MDKPDNANDALASDLEKYALVNAVRHDGRAEVGAVVSKVLGDSPELRARAREVASRAAEVVRRVNSLSVSEQQKLLLEKYPDSLEEHQRQEGRVGLPPLEGATGEGKQRVVLRLPPEPSGYMTIGHGMAGTINYLYKEQYGGELWLRFEDTNPRKVQKRYYESFRKGYSWLGIKWDHEKNVSSDLELLYEYVGTLIEADDAYTCSCPAERVKKLRFEGVPCEHREQGADKSISIWDKMLHKEYAEGSHVIRLKGDLSSLDYSLRDPNIARIIDFPHPLTGTKYNVWPTYDFEVVVEDNVCGISHVLRSSEFHVALQELIRKRLGFSDVYVKQFSRFNFRGTPVQKRLLRPLVEEKLVSGWDDPRMPTIEGVRRRGIIPEAIRDFTIQVGYTKAEHVYDWSLLFAVNRKLLDPRTRRLYFAPDPIELRVEGAPPRTVTISYHPQSKQLGERTLSTDGSFYVPSKDFATIQPGQTFRLLELYNVKLLSSAGPSGGALVGEYVGDELSQDMKKIQWVPVAGAESIEVLEPSPLFRDDGTFDNDSLRTRPGLAEPAFRELRVGDIVQFQRYGFVRVDSPGKCIFAHG